MYGIHDKGRHAILKISRVEECGGLSPLQGIMLRSLIELE